MRQHLDDAIGRLRHFLVLECSIEALEDQPKREAGTPLGDSLSRVAIEQLRRNQVLGFLKRPYRGR